MITVYSILKEGLIPHEQKDRHTIGIEAAKIYRQISPDEPIIIKQYEPGYGSFRVNQYPDEFRPILLNIIKDILKIKK